MDSLKEAREKRGIMQKKVAAHLGVTRQTYAKYEDNPRKMPVSLAKQACDFIGVDISQIFFG